MIGGGMIAAIINATIGAVDPAGHHRPGQARLDSLLSTNRESCREPFAPGD